MTTALPERNYLKKIIEKVLYLKRLGRADCSPQRRIVQ